MKVLIVEDDQEVKNRMEEHLNNAGLEEGVDFDMAFSVKHFSDLIHSQTYTAVFMDIDLSNFPENLSGTRTISGLELAEFVPKDTLLINISRQAGRHRLRSGRTEEALPKTRDLEFYVKFTTRVYELLGKSKQETEGGPNPELR